MAERAGSDITPEGIVNLASCWQSYRMPSYRGYRFPPDIISHAVWLYHRFALSFRDVEDVLARRGVDVTYEAIRKWCRRFGPEYAGRLRRRRGRLGDTWHLDEVFVTIQGRQQYLLRAVDEAGDVLDILVQPRRNRHAAVRFFRKLLKTQRHVPRRLITDKLRSYSAACRTVMPSVLHCTDQYANNRAEVTAQKNQGATPILRGRVLTHPPSLLIDCRRGLPPTPAWFWSASWMNASAWRPSMR